MKKTYEIPSVEMALLEPCTIICDSPGVIDINDPQGASTITPPGGGPIIGG